MTIQTHRPFRNCYIAAPPGLDLGALPEVLAENGISWEWARDHADSLVSPSEAIRGADFVIGIFVGTSNDNRVFYEVGIAVGMDKPVFLIARNRRLPLDWTHFPIAKVPLHNRCALQLHLEIFFKTSELETKEQTQIVSWDEVPEIRTGGDDRFPNEFHSELERRLFDTIENAGGRAIAEPESTRGGKYRPDFLAWLGHQDPDLLDPTVIEVKSGHVDEKEARRIEEKLLQFVQTTGIRSAFVLTSGSPPRRVRTLSPYLYWLDINEFENLVRDKRLGAYVRATRNRLVHGVRG